MKASRRWHRGFLPLGEYIYTYGNVSTTNRLIVSANERGGKKKLDPQTTTPSRGMLAARQRAWFLPMAMMD
jgi:hypothetical protein